MIIMYYIALLANFGNCCSIVWAYRPMKGQELWHFLFGGRGQKSYVLFYNVFLNVIFYPRVLQKFQVSKNIPVPVCLVALMIWHSGYRA